MTQTAPPSRPGPPRPVASPCVMVCTMDEASGLCLGCFRTLQEIATWGRMEPDERARIMAELASRKGRIDPRLVG